MSKFFTLLLLSLGLTHAGTLSSQIRDLHKNILYLNMVKHRILLYGLNTTKIDLRKVPEVDGTTFGEVLLKSISFRSLCASFPRYSMLVQSVGAERQDGIFAKLGLLADKLRWNVELCKVLWLPNTRTEVVNEILHSLRLPVGYDLTELEEAMNLGISRVKGLLLTLEGPLTDRAQNWLNDFLLFCSVWENLNSIIKEYEEKLEKLLLKLEVPHDI